MNRTVTRKPEFILFIDFRESDFDLSLFSQPYELCHIFGVFINEEEESPPEGLSSSPRDLYPRRNTSQSLSLGGTQHTAIKTKTFTGALCIRYGSSHSCFVIGRSEFIP